MSQRHSRTYFIDRAPPEDADGPEDIRWNVIHYTLACDDGQQRLFQMDLRDGQPLRQRIENMRRGECQPDVLQHVGMALRQCLVSAGWDAEEEHLRTLIATREPVTLYFMLSAPELFSVPWELIVDPRSGQPLTEYRNVIAVYAWPGAEQPMSYKPEGGERMLFAWAGKVPWRAHVEALERSARGSVIGFNRRHDMIDQVSPDKFAAQLERTPPASALHILCHGSTQGTSPVLIWRRRMLPMEVPIGTLRSQLREQREHMRLVVLCACHSGGGGAAGNPLPGHAVALHRVGMECVIGSRYSLSMGGSELFTARFYERLLEHHDCFEDAFRRARDHLYNHGCLRDAVSLQLFMQPAPADMPRRFQLVVKSLVSRFNREHQWARIRELCATMRESVYIALLGPQSQYVNFFSERIVTHFHEESATHAGDDATKGMRHEVYRLRYLVEDCPPTSRAEWHSRLRNALPGDYTSALDALRAAAAMAPVFLIIGERPFARLDHAHASSLIAFLGEDLPKLIAGLSKESHPVRVLIPLEETRPESPIVAWYRDAANRPPAGPKAIQYEFIRLTFPRWSEILPTIEGAISEQERDSLRYDAFIELCQGIYERIATPPNGEPNFAQLAQALYRAIERFRAPRAP